MKFLAIIVASLTTADIELTTTEPTDCLEGIIQMQKDIAAIGHEARYYCEYTITPATSPRPKARPTQ